MVHAINKNIRATSLTGFRCEKCGKELKPYGIELLEAERHRDGTVSLVSLRLRTRCSECDK